MRITVDQVTHLQRVDLQAIFGDQTIWNINELLSLFTQPLDTAKACREVCRTLRGRSCDTGELYNSAFEAWKRLFVTEVAAATDVATLENILGFVPTEFSGRGESEYPVLEYQQLALSKGVSFYTTVEDIVAFMVKHGSRYNFVRYPDVLKWMGEVAKDYHDFAELWYRCGSGTVPADIVELQTRALSQFKRLFALRVKRLKSFKAVVKEVKSFETALQTIAFEVTLEAKSFPADDLMGFIVEEKKTLRRDQPTNKLIELAVARLDDVVLATVSRVKTRAKALKYLAKYKFLPNTRTHLQQVINRDLAKGAESLNTFEDFQSVYVNASSDELRHWAWEKMMSVANLAEAEKLWNGVSDDYRCRCVIDLFLRLVGDDWAQLSRLQRRTDSPKILKKMIDLGTTKDQMLECCRFAPSELEYPDLWSSAFTKLVPLITDFFQGLQLLEGLRTEGDSTHRVLLLGRLLELAGGESGIRHLATTVKKQTLEMQTMIAVALIPYLPVEQSQVAAA